MKVSIDLYRSDLLTPFAIGNKHFKLTSQLVDLKARGCQHVLSFGGAYSNHIYALAMVCGEMKLASTAVIRGEPDDRNPVLAEARRAGMQLQYVSREQYRRRNQRHWCEKWRQSVGADAVLPEGGSNLSAVMSCRALGARVRAAVSTQAVIILPVGTGATMAGVCLAQAAGQAVIGMPVVRDSSIAARVAGWLGDERAQAGDYWQLLEQFTGRYAAVNEPLLKFILRFHEVTGIALDPIYNGPALYRLLMLGELPARFHDSPLVYIHTGGLTGAWGMRERFKSVGCAQQYFATINRLVTKAAVAQY